MNRKLRSIPLFCSIGASLFGMAATIGALSFSNLARLLARSTIYYGGLLIIAIAIIMCGIVETPTGIMFSVTIGGLLLGAGNPLTQTILQEVTPSRIAGQVFTAHTAISFAAGLIGLPIAGIFTELTNIDLVLIISGSFLAIGSAISWYFMPLST
jgi:MFS family permease